MSTATSTVTHTATGTVTAPGPQTLGQSIPAAVPALRFLTAGSVDDGKSTLIGRLLLDSKSILADQLAGLKNSSHGAAEMDLARLTDGLQAEREQGITIDVAYRYFATPQRKFIIADAPGHEQYTRNMVTAASSSDAAVVLVDVTKLTWQQQPVQLLAQTRRHALLAHLLRVPSLVFAINKLDAVNNPAQAFRNVKAALLAFAEQAGIAVAGIVPISALKGFNVTHDGKGKGEGAREFYGIYDGPTLLQLLTGLPCASAETQLPFSFPVQWVGKPGRQPAAESAGAGAGAQPPAQAGRRVFWGRIATGQVRVGDTLRVQPSGQPVQVVRLLASALASGPELDDAAAGASVGVVLDREVDISRGDWLVAQAAAPLVQQPRVTLAWLDDEPLVVGRLYWVKHGHRWVKAKVAAIEHSLNIQTLQPEPAQQLQANSIGEVTLQLQQPLPLLPYAQSRQLGALIVVDPASNRTAGAAMVKTVAKAA